MIKFDTVMQSIIESVQAYLIDNRYTKPLHIYDSIGMAFTDYVQEGSNTVVSKLYGVYRNQTSQISTVSDGLNMLTATAVIDLLVDAIPEDDGSFPEVNELTALLNECAALITGQYASIEEDGTIYAVLPVMSPATVGDYQEDSSNWGSYVPVSVQIAFTALEGALAPSAVKLEIDGKQIPLAELVISRTKAATTDVNANAVYGTTTSSYDSTTFEVQFAAPASYGKTNGILAELMSARANTPHCVVIGGEHASLPKQCYMMELAKIQLTRRNNETVGINGNLLELDPEAITTVRNEWWTTTLTASESGTASVTLSSAGEWCIFWGDGTSTGPLTISSSKSISHYYSYPGSYKVYYCNVDEMR